MREEDPIRRTSGYRRAMEWEAPKPDELMGSESEKEVSKELEKPIYWIDSVSFNQEVLSEVLNIFLQVFLRDAEDIVNEPTIEEISTALGGQEMPLVEAEVFGNWLTPFLEMRIKSSEDGKRKFLRFKAYNQAHKDVSKGFQDALDGYLTSQKIAVSLRDTFGETF